MIEEKPPLIIIAGPTAIGKTDISLELAKVIHGEIISADSMQVYKGMDVGTAKIEKTQMQNIKHHLIDVLSPTDDFNVVLFQKLAKEAIDECMKSGHLPIIVGGTGFYIQSILYDIDFSESCEMPEYREELSKLASENGAYYVHEMLKDIDPESYTSIKANDLKRTIRALEYYKQTGLKISDHNEEQKKRKPAYNCAYFVINDDREKIYARIDERVDIMLDSGLVEEVRGLKKLGLTDQNVSMRGLGYKEIYSYLDGEISLDEAVRIIKRDTRHFAKRQITWFKREEEVIYIQKNENKVMLDNMINVLKEKNII